MALKNQLAEFEKANKQQGERKEEMDIEAGVGNSF